MASSDFAQKLLHDLRLRKERMANAKNSGMHSNSRQNLKETRTLEVSGRAGNRYKNSNNTQKTLAKPKSTNQIIPYNGGYHSRQEPELSMALAYAFDDRGKLKRLDIASSGPIMNLLEQIGRKSQRQSFDIQWQSTNQFPTLTNLHINEISKGAQKLNQLLRACSNGAIDINRGSIEIGKELWKGAMELEQALRMLVSLQEASTDNVGTPQQKSRLRLLDDNEERENDRIESLKKQKQVECPVFSFDKPSKNNKMSVSKLKIHSHIENRNSKPEINLSITTSTHRRTASTSSESNTSQLTNSTTLKHNAARLPSVIAKLMGIEELPQTSNQNVATKSLASEQRLRDSVSTHTSPRSSKNAEAKIEFTRPAKKIELQENTYELTKKHYTAFDRERPSSRLEERQGINNCVRESKTAISKTNEMQNDVRKETRVKSIEMSQGFAIQRDRSLNIVKTNHAYTQSSSNSQKAREVDTRTIQIPQQTPYRNVELNQTNVSYQPHGKNLKQEHRSPRKEIHITEDGRKERDEGKMKSAKDSIRLVGSKALLNNELNEDPSKEDASKNSKDRRKSLKSLKLESAMTEKRATSYKEARSEIKEINGVKTPKSRRTTKANKVISNAVIPPRAMSRALKPHESTSQTQKQNKRDKISVSRTTTVANGRISKSVESAPEKDEDEPNHPPIPEESQQNDKNQEILIEEVVVKAPTTTDDQDDSKVKPCHQQKSMKEEIQEPLTEDELSLKQNLILSHLFLNTAEALFKLNIPITILNYASDQISEAKDCQIILDCGYELLKRKGRRKVAIIYPCVNTSVSYTQVKCLDDLVRQLNKDFEALRFYGANGKAAYDYANSIQKMMESDIYNTHPDLNSMWDIGWYDMFSCESMDEVICNVEQLMLDELVNELFNYSL